MQFLFLCNGTLIVNEPWISNICLYATYGLFSCKIISCFLLIWVFGMCLCSCVTLQLGNSSGYRKVAAEAKLKVAINGFGRIGRNFLRCWHGRKDSPLDVIAINDTGGVKQASHLLKYDSTLGIFDADVKPVGEDAISVDGKVIKVVSNRNPSNLPWK